jgi:hypothetical protein
VTLGRLVLAWLLVAVWFYVATILAELIMAFALSPPGRGLFVNTPIPILRWKVVEAGLLTLFASLWFDSLGSGQWWLVFMLVGLLATVPAQLLGTAQAPRRTVVFIGVEIGELVRYMVAGALLAWRLS